MNTPHIISPRTYLLVWVSLMLLLFVTLGLALLNLRPFNIAVALTIALAKMLLILLYFMHVKFSNRVTWLFAAAGFVWLLIMITLTMTDYLARGLPGE
jgi:cytochrome c oxidase subunit 4